MSNITQHKARTQQIIEEMGNEEISYESASVQLEEANSELLAQHVVDTPDEVIDQVYEAIAERNPSLNLTAPLLRTSHLAPHACDFFRMAEYPAKAANSSTWIEQLENLPDNRVRLRLRPFTGLRHQLRVHLDALGMPIVGDQLYPHVLHDAIAAPDYRHPLQLLAQCLSFTDPLTGQARQFQSQMTLLQR